MNDKQELPKRTESKKERTALDGGEVLWGNRRRDFLRQLGGVAAATLAAGGTALAPLAEIAGASPAPVRQASKHRLEECYSVRQDAAQDARQFAMPAQATNGDEELYTNFIGNFSKGLPHNAVGEAEPEAYRALIDAANRGTSKAFEKVPLGGSLKLANPLAGVAFDLEGPDSHQLAIEPPPPVASQARADDMVELYWMALCRDVQFTDYFTSSAAKAAASELSRLGAFAGPKSRGKVTAQTLFRGFTADDVVGPYASQFLLKPFNYGQIPISGQILTFIPGIDYMTDPSAWLAVRNGQAPSEKLQNDPQVRYIRTARDLAAYVHTDQVFQAFCNAGIWLFTHGAEANPGNPYLALAKQSPFATFGAPHFLTLLAEASNRALKVVFYSKWFVHRTLRPEEFGGLVHMTKTRKADYPVHADVLDSRALAETFSRTGTYLHPQAYPEGCPAHPAYAQGHAAVAGACATILKAAFNTDTPFDSLPGGTIQTARPDGLALMPYPGADAGEITVNGEINKLASNIAMARNLAGIHWRTDYSAGVKLGEAVALSILREQKALYSEDFSGFTLTKFSRETVTV
jgi:hypothetical protein